MNKNTMKALEKVEQLRVEAEKNLETRNRLPELVAKELIGLPYYWGEYSGVIIPSESNNKSKVVAHIFSQETNRECYWTYDSLVVYDHLKTIQEFETWEAYNLAQRLAFAEEYETLLYKYHYTEKEIEEKLRSYCRQHQVPYKKYLN